MKRKIMDSLLLLAANVFAGLTINWLFEIDAVLIGLVLIGVLMAFDGMVIESIWSNEND